MNFTQEYFPDLDDLTPAQLTAARAFVVSRMQVLFGDVDLSPGTPTGDGVISPLAAFVAASEVANGRLMSDLDLNNIANNIIYSCAFVEKYLGNFAVYDVSNLRAAGLVRLTFNTDKAYTLNRVMLFNFGGSDTYRLKVNDLDTESISIKAAGTPYDGSDDAYVLAQTSATTWSVDVPLEGTLTEAVTRGTTGYSTYIPTELVGIAAAIDFLPGVPSASIADLARMARNISHSMTAGSRAGIRAMIYRNWPESAMVSPVITGDTEMLRTVPGSAMILQQPAVDVYYRSARDLQIETQTVKLVYNATAPYGGVSGKRFRGAVSFLHCPSKILSVTWAGTSAVATVVPNGWKVFSRPTSLDFHGGGHFGTRYEEFYLDVEPTLNNDQTTVIQKTDGDNGEQYAYFTVTYVTDPLMVTVGAALESTDNAPPGVSVLVKSGPLVDLTSMTVTYYRKPGTRMVLTTAAAKIASYIASAGYPDVFRQTAVHDIMRVAGAERVVSIAVDGSILPSAASRMFMLENEPANFLAADWQRWSVAITQPDVHTVDAIVPTASIILNPDLTYGPTGSEFLTYGAWAASGRTVRCRIEPSNIIFVEI